MQHMKIKDETILMPHRHPYLPVKKYLKTFL